MAGYVYSPGRGWVFLTDAHLALPLAARVLRGPRPDLGQQLTWSREPLQVTERIVVERRFDKTYSAQSLWSGYKWPESPALNQLRNVVIVAADPFAGGRNRLDRIVVRKHALLGRLLEWLFTLPRPVRLPERTHVDRAALVQP